MEHYLYLMAVNFVFVALGAAVVGGGPLGAKVFGCIGVATGSLGFFLSFYSARALLIEDLALRAQAIALLKACY